MELRVTPRVSRSLGLCAGSLGPFCFSARLSSQPTCLSMRGFDSHQRPAGLCDWPQQTASMPENSCVDLFMALLFLRFRCCLLHGWTAQGQSEEMLAMHWESQVSRWPKGLGRKSLQEVLACKH